MTKGRPIAAGKKVRDFVLKDHADREFSLAAQRGKKVLLSFHPLAWTSVCARQMKALEKSRKAFASLGTVAVGVSIDTVPSKAAWAKALKIRSTPLLCDFWPHGKVARALGLFRPQNGFSERACVVVDEKGKAVFVKVYPIGELPDLKEIFAVLRA
ncbi:MAG: putative peroxiredoxin [Syntrophaceae bacterium PtaU1.Bin231]|nr:MAG: putative peroxiredoxin [Syntrophaceae bacterium PtaU1.Bin231]HOG16338.1 redoxin domain-containing protein [Syntrophales bacterium]